MSIIPKMPGPEFSPRTKFVILPSLLLAGLVVGVGVTAVQAALKTKKATGSVKPLPFAKNLAGQTLTNT